MAAPMISRGYTCTNWMLWILEGLKEESGAERLIEGLSRWLAWPKDRHLCFLLLQTRHLKYQSGNRNILKLHERGIFQNVFPEHRSPDLHKALISSPQCFYCGFDPTADSLHIGNLLALIALLHCQRGGHQVLAVIGGATAQIGDPSGKSSERAAIDLGVIQHNVAKIQQSLHRIFYNHQTYLWKDQKELFPAKLLDNAEWYAKRNVVEFLSSIGRHCRMGTMLLRESVQSRLKSAEGLSLAEFTYQAFQAYDWLHLHAQHNCIVQIGGNDQMGNILAGHDLISRVHNKSVYGLTVPLITSASGLKLGKTAADAIWLNSDKTSPFALYQYFVRLPDSDMERYLKLYTFISDEDIAHLMKKHRETPDCRKAQKTLAEQVTLLVHGEEGLKSAVRCSQALYTGSSQSLVELTEEELQDLFRSAPVTEMFLDPGTSVFDVVMKAKLFDREVDAHRIISEGGIYINHQRVSNPEAVLTPGQHILPSNITLIRRGKRNYHIIKWLG